MSLSEAYLNYFSNEKPLPQKKQKKYQHSNTAKIRQMADGNIDTVETMADIIKKLCNAAWGTGWGEFSPDLKRGENAASIVLPQITIGINEKDVAEGMNIKPCLTDVKVEVDANGNETGETFLIYRQWFDYNIEFDIYAETSASARKLKNKFEKLLNSYTGYLKRQGISEIIFSKEVPAQLSLNYNEKVTMIPIYYYMRFEEISVVKKSTLDKIDMELGVSKVNVDKVITTLENGESARKGSDIHFYTGEDENTYNV